jgi:membrane protein
MTRSEIVPVLKETWQQFGKHNGQWLAAALAYFAAFAVAPLIIVIVEIVGLVLGNHHQTLNLIFGYLQHDAGGGAAGAIRSIVSSTFNQHHRGAIAQIIAWIVFIIAAAGLFSAVQFALNTAWDVQPKKSGWKEMLAQRLSAFAVMMGIALLLLVSMGVNALLTIAAGALAHVFPMFPTLLKIADFAISFGVIWLGFAVLFEYLPDTRVEWSDVWAGAAFTSLLFVVGQFLLGWYLGRAGISSTFGAFGSLVVFLIWVNYSAQIMLFGAEFTHVYSMRHGSRRQAQSTRGEVTLEGRPRVQPR